MTRTDGADHAVMLVFGIERPKNTARDSSVQNAIDDGNMPWKVWHETRWIYNIEQYLGASRSSWQQWSQSATSFVYIFTFIRAGIRINMPNRCQRTFHAYPFCCHQVCKYHLHECYTVHDIFLHCVVSSSLSWPEVTLQLIKTHWSTSWHACLAMHQDFAVAANCWADETDCLLEMRQQVCLSHIWHVNQQMLHGQLPYSRWQIWHVIDDALYANQTFQTHLQTCNNSPTFKITKCRFFVEQPGHDSGNYQDMRNAQLSSRI